MAINTELKKCIKNEVQVSNVDFQRGELGAGQAVTRVLSMYSWILVLSCSEARGGGAIN